MSLQHRHLFSYLSHLLIFDLIFLYKDIPLKPENLIEEDVTTTTILVSWDQDYSVHYYQAIIADGEDSVMSVQNFGDVMYGLAENLIPDTVHTITVIPYGKNDIAGPAVHIDIRTSS